MQQFMNFLKKQNTYFNLFIKINEIINILKTKYIRKR